MLIILGEYIHYLGEYIHYCKLFKGDRTRCRPTTVLMSTRAIRLSHVRNRHLIAIVTALSTFGTHCHPRNCAKSIERGWYSGTPSVCRSAFNLSTLSALYCVVDDTGRRKISIEAVETGPFTDEFRFTLFSSRWLMLINRRHGERFAYTYFRGIDLGWRFCYGLRRHISWCK